MKAVKLMIATVMMAQIATTAHADFARPGSKNKKSVEVSKDQKKVVEKEMSFLNVKNYNEFNKFKRERNLDWDKKINADRCFTSLGDPQNNYKLKKNIDNKDIEIIKDLTHITNCLQAVYTNKGDVVFSAKQSDTPIGVSQRTAFLSDSDIKKLEALANKKTDAKPKYMAAPAANKSGGGAK